MTHVKVANVVRNFGLSISFRGIKSSGSRKLINYSDANVWVDYWHSPGVLAGYIIVGIISFALLGLSIWKLVEFFKAFGPQVSIPTVSLVMEGLSNIGAFPIPN